MMMVVVMVLELMVMGEKCRKKREKMMTEEGNYWLVD